MDKHRGKAQVSPCVAWWKPAAATLVRPVRCFSPLTACHMPAMALLSIPIPPPAPPLSLAARWTLAPPAPQPLIPFPAVSRPAPRPSLPQALTPCPPFQNGLTPLHVAAHYDNQKVALLLLEKGASPHATAKVSPPAMRAAWGQPAPPRPQVHSPLGGVSKGVRNVYSGQAYGEWAQGELISGLGAMPWYLCIGEGSPEGSPDTWGDSVPSEF